MNYGTAGGGRRKIRRGMKIALAVCAIALIGLYVLGATLGSDSEQRKKISQAIEENEQLRSELKAKDERINELDEEINRLKVEIASMPTPEPTPYQPEVEEMYEGEVYDESEEVRSPRE